MKKAKIALTAVALLAVIGGALAFKANNRQFKTFYLYTTTLTGDAPTGACLSTNSTQLQLTPAANGVLTSVSDKTIIGVTTCQVRVIPNA